QREVLSIHVGQAGVQMGNAIWELYCAEHAIGLDGQPTQAPLEQECQSTFFQQSPKGQHVPRALFIDLEPSVVDEIRVGPWRKLYHPDRLITGYEDAANNFARGFFTIGKLLIAPILSEIRRSLESCEAPQGIILYRSLGGGTGAGLTAALLDVMPDFHKLTKIEIPVYPSPSLSNSLVEPYNSLLGEHFAMEDIQLGLLMDNEALYDICGRYLGLTVTTYTSINRLIAQATSAITASLRFPNILNGDINVIQTNLVPYPRIHFPLSNFAPCISWEKAEHETLTTRELTLAVFDRENQMVKVDPTYGKFMSCTLLYRGDVSPSHVYQALTELKSSRCIEFVDWCPTGFKVGLTSSPPVSVPDSRVAQCDKNVVMLANNSSVGQAWQRLTHKFYLLYSKRSFVHWFIGEGMEESEFNDALINMTSLVKDYEEASGESKVENE
ncbi:tubulin alpha, partial [Clonorchis sinensis]